MNIKVTVFYSEQKVLLYLSFVLYFAKSTIFLERYVDSSYCVVSPIADKSRLRTTAVVGLFSSSISAVAALILLSKVRSVW